MVANPDYPREIFVSRFVRFHRFRKVHTSSEFNVCKHNSRAYASKHLTTLVNIKRTYARPMIGNEQ